MKNINKIIAVQADSLNSINIFTDTTFLLCLEAQRRGFNIFWYQTSEITLSNKKVAAKGYFVKFFDRSKNFYVKKNKTELNLATSKYILILQNPPFDM